MHEFKISKHHTFTYAILLALLIILVGCSSIDTGINGQPTETEVVSPTKENTATPISTKTLIPTRTKLPTKTYTPTPDLPYLLKPFPNSTYLISDLEGDEEWDEIAQLHARNLSVPQPYHYEFYMLPENTSVKAMMRYVEGVCGGMNTFLGVTDVMFYRCHHQIDGIGQVGYRIQHWTKDDLLLILYVMPE